ncbi:hypothetical protein CI610_03330 [invertebrate metagenome]|uniref:SGNH hydrolase-type esterase domain-containing protein n=1 Tax=invertebrate metagenome TaxID=1711999 RepID=A0A2H9T3D4_9ZZZZ
MIDVFRDLSVLRDVLKKSIPLARYYFTIVPISEKLAKTKPRESDNLSALNRHLLDIQNKATVTLDSRIAGGHRFNSDGIHWTEATANELVRSWVSQVKNAKVFFA